MARMPASADRAGDRFAKSVGMRLAEHRVLNVKKRARIVRIAGVVVAGGGLAIAAAGVSSAATQYTVPLHQTPPITAAGFSGHEPQCANIPSTQDGWAFVLPGNDTVFISLTVTFSPGGTQTITTFGPPSDKHAYVASAPGAVLESASASVETTTGKTQVPWFNLSHTCPASPQPSGSPTTPTGSPTTPTGSPTTPSGSPTTPTGSPTTPSGSPAPTGTTPSSASASPSPTSAPPAPAPTPVPGN